ncbi:MAG: hypothetical protein ACRET6_12575 [Burkholderiales bacterium]
MNSTQLLRRWLLAVALVGTVAAAGWVGNDAEGDRVVATTGTGEAGAQQERTPERRPVAASSAADGTLIDTEKLKRTAPGKVGEMFASRNWQPPPSPVARGKPEPPRAPPLPFRFFGRLVDNGTTVVFLNRQDDVYAVKAGDTIDGAYRVEDISGSEVVLTYLPLKQRQTLPIGTLQ